MGKKESKKDSFPPFPFSFLSRLVHEFFATINYFFFPSRDNGRSVITSADYRTSRMTSEDSLKKFVSAAIGKVE